MIRLHGRIPVEDVWVWQPASHRLHVPRDPIGPEHRIDRLEESPHRVITDHCLYREAKIFFTHG